MYIVECTDVVRYADDIDYQQPIFVVNTETLERIGLTVKELMDLCISNDVLNCKIIDAKLRGYARVAVCKPIYEYVHIRHNGVDYFTAVDECWVFFDKDTYINYSADFNKFQYFVCPYIKDGKVVLKIYDGVSTIEESIIHKDLSIDLASTKKNIRSEFMRGYLL